MTEQQMPARIYVDETVLTMGRWDDTFGDVAYVRADIAERMAEALEEVKAKYDFDDCLPDDHPIKKVRSALSVFKGASHV